MCPLKIIAAMKLFGSAFVKIISALKMEYNPNSDIILDNQNITKKSF
jgi:hypothetical protein